MLQVSPRQLLDQVDDWVNRLVASVGSPTKVDVSEDSFAWRFPEENLAVAIAAKAVRLASSWSGALTLSEHGQTTEACSLLRLVEDFTWEIWFLCDSAISERANRAQRRFIRHFFAPQPRTMNDFLDGEREHWVARRDVLKVVRRMAQEEEADREGLAAASQWVSWGLNGYVHGSYDTAMELYDESSARFRIQGHAKPEAREAAEHLILVKGLTACATLVLAARVLDESSLAEEIRAYLSKSGVA